MSKTAKIILAAVGAVFVGFFIWAIIKNQTSEEEEINYDNYSNDVVYLESLPEDTTTASGVKLVEVPSEVTKIGDHIKGGDIQTAKIVLFEYADYQCPGCATVNPWVNDLLDEYEGQVAIVYRNFLLPYHQNARAAAAAANAAGLQGYWKEYMDMLFRDQSSWGSAASTKRNTLFISYFREIAGDDADVDKFRSDLSSKTVSAKVEFDYNLGKKMHLESTPSIYYNGELIDWYEASTEASFKEYFRNFLDPLLK